MTQKEYLIKLYDLEYNTLNDIICEQFNAETNVWFDLWQRVSMPESNRIVVEFIVENVPYQELVNSGWISED